MTCDALIFDLDGTLWDATPEILKTWQMVLSRHPGIRGPLTMEELQGLMGLQMDEIARRMFPDVPPETRISLMEECMQMENEYLKAHGATLYPKLCETLRALKQRYKLCIVSNAQSGYIEAFLTAHSLWELFDDHLAFGDTGNPKGENIRAVVARNGFTAPVYVGDTQGDHDAAAAAGVPFIYAAYGFGTVTDYAAEISAFSQLTDLF